MFEVLRRTVHVRESPAWILIGEQATEVGRIPVIEKSIVLTLAWRVALISACSSLSDATTRVTNCVDCAPGGTWTCGGTRNCELSDRRSMTTPPSEPASAREIAQSTTPSAYGFGVQKREEIAAGAEDGRALLESDPAAPLNGVFVRANVPSVAT